MKLLEGIERREWTIYHDPYFFVTVINGPETKGDDVRVINAAYVEKLEEKIETLEAKLFTLGKKNEELQRLVRAFTS